MNIPDDTLACVNDIVIPVSWTTIDEIHTNSKYSMSYYADGGYDTYCWTLYMILRIKSVQH